MEEERDSIPGFFKVVRVTFGRSRLVESSTTPLHQRFPFRGLMVPLYAPSKLLVTVMSVRPFLFRFCFFFLILDQTKHARTFLTEFQNKTKETKIEREREKKKILDISSSSGACPPTLMQELATDGQFLPILSFLFASFLVVVILGCSSPMSSSSMSPRKTKKKQQQTIGRSRLSCVYSLRLVLFLFGLLRPPLAAPVVVVVVAVRYWLYHVAESGKVIEWWSSI